MAASRSSSRSRRSERSNPRGRKLSNRRSAISARLRRVAVRDKKNEPKVVSEWLGARGEGEDMDVSSPDRYEGPIRTRSSGGHDHHIAADGSRQPGLNPVNPDAALEKKLAELRSLVDRMEIIASIQPTSGRAAMVIREQAECGSDTLAPSATKESALEHARNRIMGIAESINISRCHLQESARSVVGYEFAKPKADNPAGEATSTKSGLGLLFDAISQLAYQAECIRDDVTHLTSAL